MLRLPKEGYSPNPLSLVAGGIIAPTQKCQNHLVSFTRPARSMMFRSSCPVGDPGWWVTSFWTYCPAADLSFCLTIWTRNWKGAGTGSAGTPMIATSTCARNKPGSGSWVRSPAFWKASCDYASTRPSVRWPMYRGESSWATGCDEKAVLGIAPASLERVKDGQNRSQTF